jgi:hypothetical protein
LGGGKELAALIFRAPGKKGSPGPEIINNKKKAIFSH